MDSVDDSIVTTPADTSNLSTPDSSSSEFSQPTVRLRANVAKDNLNDRICNKADCHQPFLQITDQDGRRLVETTGRTAQRARALIRQGSRLNDRPPEPKESSKSGATCGSVGYQPRKYWSTTSIPNCDKNANRKIKRRHHSCGVHRSRRSWDTLESPEIFKRYSVGEYLRQQILDDLNSNEMLGKTEEQIAHDRCNRVKAYLRRRNADSPHISPQVKLKELRDYWKSEGIRNNTIDSVSASYNAIRRNDLDRISAYLQDKIRAKMNEEMWRNWEKERLSSEYPKELSIQDIREKYCDYRRAKEREDYPTRRVRSEANVRRDATSSSGSAQYDENLERVAFPGLTDNRRKNGCRRTRSEVIPETVIDSEDGEVRKRFYSYSEVQRKNWKTKSCLTFEKKLSLPSKSFMNLERETEPSSSSNNEKNGKLCKNMNSALNDTVQNQNRKKHCRRSRSDTLSDKVFETPSFKQKTKKRSVSWSDKRKLQSRKSDRFAVDAINLESDANYPMVSRRTKIPQSNLCSWREYKEKRRQERLLRETTNSVADEDLRMISVPRVAREGPVENAEPTSTDVGKSKVNSQSVPTSEQDSRENLNYMHCKDDPTNDLISKGPLPWTKKCNVKMHNVSGTPDDTETETILQENYLLLDKTEIETSNDAGICSPIISKLQVNEYRDADISFGYDYNVADFGYDTIPKRRGKNGEKLFGGWTAFSANSKVKKTDTFKIIDGSEKCFNDDDHEKVEDLCNSDATSWPLDCRKNPLDGRTPWAGNDGALVDTGVRIDRGSVADYNWEISPSHPCADEVPVLHTNKDVAKDYFKRVYELLKQRQDFGRRKTVGILAPARNDGNTSSSNYSEEEARRRRRRRKKDKAYQGEELVAVSPGVGQDDGWSIQTLLANDDPGGNLIFRRPQLQNVTGQKRLRHPAPPIPANCKINAKDISKYFDYPNKENSNPSNDLNGNERKTERNDPKEYQRRVETKENEMGSNLSRHNGKGLTGRRTQSSGNLCDPKGKLNHVGKILVPCSSSQRDRYKICGSLPNHLDDKEMLEDEDPGENNNVISDTMVGNLGGTLPHKKRALGVHFSDTGPTGTLDLVNHRSQESLEGDPWRYQEGVDLDLVRCKHGNYDLVRKNQSADVVDGDSSSRRYGTMGRPSGTKCHRGADLDLVGALPKRKPGSDSKGSSLRQSFEARQKRVLDRLDDDLLIKAVHKPDCELVKHRQLDRAVDLKLSRLIGGEPQDQGYASERSPEDEHPPSLPGQHFPNVTPESTFRVTLQKSSRGLGLSVSGGGTAGPVRVKRLFPQQPAALSNKLQPGDILLAANGIPLTGLTNYEALEVLRTTSSTVELVVCRVPGDANITPPGVPPPPPVRREPPPPLRIFDPLPPLQIEPCGEFDIEMTKVAGSLGFTLRKVDSSALGHYVRALVREPALSDGRIQPGDKIVAVDGATLSPMSHEEAVALLRQCGPRVKLRLYRDLAQTPVSALSPTEPDHPLRPPRTSLRQEAVDMLCDLAVRKLSPGTSNGSSSMQTSGTSCNSPRRLRRPHSRTPTTDNDPENHLTFHPVNPLPVSHFEGSDTDPSSIKIESTHSQSDTPSNDDIIDPPPLYDVCDSSDSSKLATRPSFLDLGASVEKSKFPFSLESDSEATGPTIIIESDSNPAGQDDSHRENIADESNALSSDELDNNLPTEPASMPPLLSTTRITSGVFSYKNPAYQSANPTCGGIDTSAKSKLAHSSDHDIPGKVLSAENPVGSKGLLKWKGVMFAPTDSVDEATKGTPDPEGKANDAATESAARQNVSEDGSEVFMVELTRGWNSRLGFSLQAEGNSTVISVVHPDSVAAKDGRLKQGDVLIMVNDESVEDMPTAEIIDLLRKIRGSIGITVMRKNKKKNAS